METLIGMTSIALPFACREQSRPRGPDMMCPTADASGRLPHRCSSFGRRDERHLPGQGHQAQSDHLGTGLAWLGLVWGLALGSWSGSGTWASALSGSQPGDAQWH